MKAGRGRWLLGAILLGVPARVPAQSRAECVLGWRVNAVAPAPGVVRCHDGDPACDVDGAVDGGCSFDTAVCLNTTRSDGSACAAAVTSLTVQGAEAAPLAAAAALVTYPVTAPEICTAPARVRVALGGRRRRGTTLVARARDERSGAHDRDRLRLSCARSETAHAQAVVITSDLSETGFVTTVGVEPPRRARRLPAAIHYDAVVRTALGRAFVVNRLGGDNIQVVDPRRGGQTLLQCSVGRGANPHDIAVIDEHKAYVTRYDRPELWIVDPSALRSCDGFFRGAIDLGPYADSDGIPEMDQMAVVGTRLFVSLQRLAGAQPSGHSALIVIDTQTDTVTGTVELVGRNAFGDASGIGREPDTGKLVIAEAGNIYHTGDGGLERIDPEALVSEGFIVSEDDLGGNITDFVLVSATKGYAVVEDDSGLHNFLLAFDPSTRTVLRRLLTREDFLPDIARAPDGLLWVADRALRAPGIRIFDPSDDHEVTRGPIDVGLPPFAMGFVP